MLSLLRPDCEKSVMDEQAKQKLAHDWWAKSREWIVGDRVLVRKHCEGPDWIPATVIEVLGPVTYTVETEQGYKRKWHAYQMKNWLNFVSPFAQAPSETVSDELEMAESEGDPPAAMEPPGNSSAGETSEADAWISCRGLLIIYIQRKISFRATIFL